MKNAVQCHPASALQ